LLNKNELSAALLLKLKASALDAQDLKALGIQAYTAAEVAAKPSMAVRLPAAGFVIPYYDVNSEYVDFFRFRYLEPPARNGFAALTVQKELRYTQPPALKPRVYFSPLFPWKELLARKPEERSFYITEGELKANCACKHGFPTLALGGVWNFRSARANQPLIPDLEQLDLKDVAIYIVYDSDAVTNPEVLKAENALARQLLKRGAVPKVLRLPELAKFKKVGLDDYLVARGAASFAKLTGKAEEWAASRALHEFNEEFLFLRESATVLDLEQRHRWTAQTAVNSVLVNRTFTVTEHRKKDAVMVEKRTAAEWLKWDGRGQLETVTYKPGAAPIVEGCWNGWRGWGLEETAVKRGSVEPWRELLDFIFDGHDVAHRRWFEQWLAYPLQHPGTKLFTATVLWGAQGTGKTLIGHTMSRIYGENYTEVNERELHGGFNEWAEYKQFALGDEITSGDKRGVADHLKGLITQKFLRINPKHIKPYCLPDCINWLFTSNHCDAFFLEDDDRRYFVIEILKPPLPQAFYDAYDAWYKSDAGAGALFYHLLHLDLKNFSPMAPPPLTTSKQEMIADGRSDLAHWCSVLKELPEEALKNVVLGGGDLSNKRTLWTVSELLARYEGGRTTRVTANGMSRELKRSGFRKVLGGVPVWTGQGPQKLWQVRAHPDLNIDSKPEAFARVWAAERGEKIKPPKEKF
jgi:hypothetical protein